MLRKSHNACYIPSIWAVVKLVNVPKILKLNLMLLSLVHFQPFLVNPLGQVKQYVGDYKQIAHESWHLMHLEDALFSLIPLKVKPILHFEFRAVSLIKALQTAFILAFGTCKILG